MKTSNLNNRSQCRIYQLHFPIFLLMVTQLISSINASDSIKSTESNTPNSSSVDDQATNQSSLDSRTNQNKQHEHSQVQDQGFLSENQYGSGEKNAYLYSELHRNDQPTCTLGNDTFQLGERWNPHLPKFGIQACVLCECNLRQRKSCYETKVACRRITDECPTIETCPDGNEPKAPHGQCCKSCTIKHPATSPEEQPTTIGRSVNLLNRNERMTGQESLTLIEPHTSHLSLTQIDKAIYRNQRVKEYQSILKNFKACNSKKEDNDKHRSSSGSRSNSGKSKNKVSKTSINGIDTRFSLKSFRESSNNYLTASGNSKHSNETGQSNESQSQQSKVVNNSQDQQMMTARKLAQTNSCILGNDVYQIGDKWRPILPPLGVQVCVQCNCISVLRPRKRCYEVKVTCRRVNNDCPIIEPCPEGRTPIATAGQCCKSCLLNDEQMIVSSVISSERTQKNDKAMKEFQSISKAFPSCVKRDINNTEIATDRNNQDVTPVKRSSGSFYSTFK